MFVLSRGACCLLFVLRVDDWCCLLLVVGRFCVLIVEMRLLCDFALLDGCCLLLECRLSLFVAC